MSISREQIETIRDHCDIVELVGAFIPLKRAGGAYKALCPFHKEKTPSFQVHPQKQIYHCFGCGSGGDVFRFVMQREGLDFVGAAKFLANRAGLRLEFDEQKETSGTPKDTLFTIAEAFADLFQRCLAKADEAELARNYLAERSLPKEMQERFRLGYAPTDWKPLIAWAARKGYTEAQLESTGLLAQSNRGPNPYYPRFRARIIFPISDELGRVIGFSGRLVRPDAKGAKYVNGPETPLFRKSRVLYAMDHARKAILEARMAIVCEGPVDVIRCHQAGIEHAIAPQGTALTEDHLRVIRRYADALTLVFDADQAGQDAALRASALGLQAGLAVRVATLPAGSDPDSMLREQGATAFLDAVNQALSPVAFQLQVQQARGETFDEDLGLLRASRAVLKTIQHAPSAVLRNQLLQEAATYLNVSPRALEQDLHALGRSKPSSSSQQPEAPLSPSPATRSYPREELALAELLSQCPALSPLVQQHLGMEHITDPRIRTIVDALLDPVESQRTNLLAALGDKDDETKRLAAQVQMAPHKITGEDATPDRAVQDLILVLRRRSMERERQALKEARRAASGEERVTLDAECKQLTVWIQTLRQGWEEAVPILEL